MLKYSIEYKYKGKTYTDVVAARSSSHARDMFGQSRGETITHIWPVNEFGGHR